MDIYCDWQASGTVGNGCGQVLEEQGAPWEG
ncbi:hypothetical protein F441_12411 [Phytophthora nicotianae CJ01A1]|uniref:Uncharacterized protein n=1 Tax=Phytophthora nicotianae CJ01A1 TaxID=1317063 RepID=W2WRM0_PHYNI|nr:hypothetical protein F441_12411 [Phytophthora nicotianae CJ01A1]